MKYLISLLVFISITTVCFAQADKPTAATPALSQNGPPLTPPPLDIPATPNFQPPPPPSLPSTGYLLMDADTGKVLAEKNMNQKMPPASLTKLMTLYLVFQALQHQQIHLNDEVPISVKAWRTGGSRMFLQEGKMVPVESLLQGVIVASGNDACVALSEYIAGNEVTFTSMMNQAASQLDMKNSHFTDSTGLPNPSHYSTPYDMAVLSRSIIQNFPDYYHYFAQQWLVFNHIKQPNRNRLLWRNLAVDGLKTGHTNDAGFCLASSAKRANTRLIAVIMGASSDRARANEAIALLNYGFRFYETQLLYPAGKTIIQQRIHFGKKQYATFGLHNPLYVTIPRYSAKDLKVVVEVDKSLKAPIKKGQPYGKITVTLKGTPWHQVALIALEDDPSGNFWNRIRDHILGWFGK